MKIIELQPRQGKVEITATIIDKEEPRSFSGGNGSGTVANATIQDESGKITLTLWNDDAGKYAVGEKIKISNGWVSEWQGRLQLSAGKFGKIEKV